MATITIDIPEKILKRGSSQRLLVVNPKDFARDLKKSWEIGDAAEALKIARQEHRLGKLKELKSLRQLMK